MSSFDNRRGLEIGVAAGAGITAGLLYAYRTNAPWLNPTPASVDNRYQGVESYADPKALSTGLVEDLKALGFKAGEKDLHTLVQTTLAKGKPIDDKQMTVENCEPLPSMCIR